MGHLGEAVPVPLVLSEPHTLGAGVSTVCGVGSFKMLCELRSVAQQAFRGGGALAGSVMLAVLVFKQWRG